MANEFSKMLGFFGKLVAKSTGLGFEPSFKKPFFLNMGFVGNIMK